MARSFGRVFASIWSDDDFRAVPVDSRLMYVFLISQPDLDHAGVIPLRVRRWSRALGVTVTEVEKMLADLNGGLFTVTDADTEELLVRSLIRRDEVWKQPNVFKSAAASAAAVASTAIKQALLAEVRRLDVESASRDIQRTRNDLVTLLEPFGNPSPTPPEGHSGEETTHVDAPAEPGDTAKTPKRDTTRNVPAQNPQRGVLEGLPRGTSELRGKAKGEGEKLVRQKPPPPTPPDVQPPLMFAVADAKAGEGGIPGEEPTPVADLAAEIRKTRPEWSTRSVRTALEDPAVAERPWPIIAAAMRIIAADKTTKSPGRLKENGPWWAEAAAREATSARAAAAHAANPRKTAANTPERRPHNAKRTDRTFVLFARFGGRRRLTGHDRQTDNSKKPVPAASRAGCRRGPAR